MAIDRVTQACHHCAALRQTLKVREEPSSDAVGVSFAANVINRSRQLVLVLRECETTFTAATLLEDERHYTLCDALIRLCVPIRPLHGPPAIIRTDPASGFKALTEDILLERYRINVEVGNAKNRNKNLVAERAVQKVQNELLRHDPLGGPASPVTLAVATATLNARIRLCGLSAREMWTQLPCEQSLSIFLDTWKEERRPCQPPRLSLICCSSKEMDESVQFRLVKPVFLICASSIFF